MADQNVQVSHLLIKHTDSRNPISRRTRKQVTLTPKDAMTELQEIKNSILRLAGTDNLQDVFFEKANERSDCSSFQNYGDLGSFGRGAMQAPFEEASFALAVGEMTENVVDTDSGYHLIYRIA